MSTTRRAEPNSPLSSEKYMSSPEYAELRGLSGIAVATKAHFYTSARKRSLIFFVQALSLQPGGLKKLAADLVAAYPERLGSATMHEQGIRKGKIYSIAIAEEIRSELQDWDFSDAEFADGCDLRPAERRCDKLIERCAQTAPALIETALAELAINPRIDFDIPGETDRSRERIQAARPDVSQSEFKRADVDCFADLTGAMLDFQTRYAQKAAEETADTELRREIFKRLDRAARHRKMVLLEGEPGIGKTKAVETWCKMHLGEARFVSLSGCVNKTSVFSKIARALGLAAGYMRTATEMQRRIEDMLQRSGLMLVIDEAHFLLPQSERIYSRPELIDWINTACCNESVPVSLVATPQFRRRLDQVERQTIWQSGQLRRRIKDMVVLNSKTSDGDLQAVAEKLLPGCSRSTLKLIVGHAKLSQWPLTWIGNLAEDARLVAAENKRSEPNWNDINEAIEKFRAPSDLAQATKPEENLPKRSRRSTRPQTQPAEQSEPQTLLHRGNLGADNEAELQSRIEIHA